MVFKGKQFKVVEAIDSRGLTYVGKLFEQDKYREISKGKEIIRDEQLMDGDDLAFTGGYYGNHRAIS